MIRTENFVLILTKFIFNDRFILSLYILSQFVSYDSLHNDRLTNLVK